MGTQSEPWIQASRLLRCGGFGATGPAIDAFVSSASPEAAIDSFLVGGYMDDPGASATPMPSFRLLKQPSKSAASDELEQYRNRLATEMDELTQWWIQRMVAVEQPAREKLTLLWHNHFATSAAKVQKAPLMAMQNEKLRAMCMGDFDTLAYAMLTDAATITWLDGQANRAEAPNENLSREFLELFGLGHGNGYSEADVREGARALTGWVIGKDGVPALDDTRFDRDVKTVLGTTGELDAGQFCGIVLNHERSPAFVAGRLWQQIASDDPPSPEALDRLVAAYGPKHDLRALTFAVLADPEFAESHGSMIVRPIDWLVGVLRTLRVPVDEPARIRQVIKVLKVLGQLPFYPPNVSGWPHGQPWLSTAAVSFRVQAVRGFIGKGDISVVSDAAPTDRIDAVGYLVGIGEWTDSTAAVLRPLSGNPPALVAAAVNAPEYMAV